ncbi:MAG: hypothetical protein WDO74_09330 [Pseudomonadota bacterium]
MQAAACNYNSSNLFTPFANDSSGRQIFFGPYLTPLLARTDVTDRLRVVVNRHTLEPHEAAIPLALLRQAARFTDVGQPRRARRGLQGRPRSGQSATRRLSRMAFSIAGSFVPTDNVLTMVAAGQHPGAARPLHIKVDNALRLSALLERAQIGGLDDRTSLRRAPADVLRAVQQPAEVRRDR